AAPYRIVCFVELHNARSISKVPPVKRSSVEWFWWIRVLFRPTVLAKGALLGQSSGPPNPHIRHPWGRTSSVSVQDSTKPFPIAAAPARCVQSPVARFETAVGLRFVE